MALTSYMFPKVFYMTMTHRLLDATGVWYRAFLSYGSGRVGAVEVLVGVPVSEALVVVTDTTAAQLKGQTHCIHVQLPCYTRSKTLHSCTSVMVCKVRHCIHVQLSCSIWSETLHLCTSVMFYKVRHCSHVQLSCSIWSETLHSCTTVTVYKDRDIAFK